MSPNDQLLNQLLRDETFFRWVHRTDPVAIDYWEDWLGQHPEHGDTVAAAAHQVQGIPFAARQLSEAQVHEAWLNLQTRLPDARVRPLSAKLPINRQIRTRVAAAVAFIVLAGTLAWWSTQSEAKQVVYTTAYGETQTVYLPDGSEVTLNANSQLTYRAEANTLPQREVWIVGEAFFKVVHLDEPTPVPFLVHTPDLRVHVLGTEFNVNTRRGRTQVVLNAGRVELQLPTEEKTAMLPGELAEYAGQATQVHKETVDTELFTAWRDRRLKFDDTPLSEVALMLEENYGVRVVFDDPSLRLKRVTGEISARKIDTILKALSTLFSITIERSGDTVHLQLPS